jgi:23S rRNA (cytidine1920-2'-O)/16S rRNA (cytidine1409-2'-O)-methyltransferase
MAQEKKRLDQRVQELVPQYSRQQIQSWIMQGKVTVDGAVVTKPGMQVTGDMEVQVHVEEPKYVSRAGFKLEKALDHFGLDVTGLVALDAGISTGGFTDCLLQRGAQKVYGIDVGYGQVHHKVLQDPRLILKERTNLRLLEGVGELVDIVTLDLSFISVLKVMDVIDRILKQGGHLLILIKPQFEAEKHEVGKGGIIRDVHIHAKVVERVTQGVVAHNYTLRGVIESPLQGGSGNTEFLAYFIKN